MAYEDRTYHGVQQGPESEGERHPARLLVEVPEFGPTERQYGITVLRELAEPEGGGFGWGYNGGGTSAAGPHDGLRPGAGPGCCGFRCGATRRGGALL
ncbi:hypothetical protein MHW47_22410 [Streptomyces sp. OfavH-34-F]|uniref:hypothetical protein n=1 Tax=Streptomyces sp. OfavH-34-F TaxID=2917760 RepID=UPI001EF31999|nr:hypothetical protein [Streptomyces sp. OfavH-34-F]MCG7527187.1 hypothetical protein [Streptomyces sp. OfavH-34-F]